MQQFQIILIQNSRPKKQFYFNIPKKRFIPLTAGVYEYFECDIKDAKKLLRNLKQLNPACKLYLNYLVLEEKS